MARKRPRRAGSTPPEEQPKAPLRDEGTDTSADTSHVNAPTHDKAIYRDPMVGKRFGKCHIRELIGEGKTAVVYKAIYTPLKRTVAIKVLHEHMTKVPAVVRVFEQEGRAVAALDHENVLKIFDVGEADGKHYLVLELLKGKDLLRVLEEAEGGRLEVDDALDYVRQAAAGLAAAHRKNLVHRDIKPQNLVLEPDGSVKIVDFGLAAEAEGAYAGGKIGTPHYMSPEQCRGEAAVTASDIYSLGITLFHLLVGHPPYAGRHSTEEIIEEHLKPHRLEPEKLVKGLPRKVGDLVRRMTRHDPTTRPSAKDVLDLIAKLTPEKLAAGGVPRKRRGGGGRHAQSTGVPTGLYVGIGFVVIALVIFVATRGGDEPVTPTPKPIQPKPPPVKEAREEKPAEPEVGGELKDEIAKLLTDAKQEERTGNIEEAYRLYRKVIFKAPAGSREGKEALAAAKALKERFAPEEEQTPKERAKYVTVKQSEEAGQEFTEREAEFRELLRTFQAVRARQEMEKLLTRTRTETVERKAIEAGLKRVEQIERLVELIASRTEGLSLEKARWINLDMTASSDLFVAAADAKGITLKDESTGLDEVRSWAQIGPRLTVDFIEELRNKSSAWEALWMGHLCQLFEDARAERYFDFALMLDSTPEMKLAVKEIRGE